MPTTTNNLESSHGQLNKKTPRRNNFWMSIYRISKSFSNKIQEHSNMFKHNFYYAKNKTLDKLKMTTQQEMNNLIIFYNTSQKLCKCGENKLISSIIGLDLPCSHRCYFKENFPEPYDFELNFEQQWKNLEIDYNVVESNEVQLNSEPYTKRYARSMIKFYSHYNSKTEIKCLVYISYDI